MVIGALVGGSGLCGLLFFFLRRYIEKKLGGVEEEEQKRRAARIRRTQIEDELHHAYGRLFFWLYRAVITGNHNGELDDAFQDLQNIEQHKKKLDREIIAEREQE